MKFDLSIKGQLSRAAERLRLSGDDASCEKLKCVISLIDKSKPCIAAIADVGSIWEHKDEDSMISIAEITVPQSIASGAPVRVVFGGITYTVNIYDYSPQVDMAKCESANGVMFVCEKDVVAEDVARYREICAKLAEDGQSELRFNGASKDRSDNSLLAQ